MSYADVNGLHMYYEAHGTAQEAKRPLVLLHGAFSGIETSFGAVLPGLAKERQVIAVEMQAHARTNDTDRPLTWEGMAEDVAALLVAIGVAEFDIFGYSIGGEVAVQIAVTHPGVVGKLVIGTPSYRPDGVHPELSAGDGEIDPEMLVGSPFHDEYLRTAPDPDAFPTLAKKVSALNASYQGWDPEVLRGLTQPVLLIAGDADIVRPEHVTEMFRLFGGGVPGDLYGVPASRLAILPGTTHITLLHRPEWIVPMVGEFLDA